MSNRAKKSPVPLQGRGKQKGGLGHEEKLSLYGVAKQRQTGVSDYILTHHPEMVKEVKALDSCGKWLTYKFFPTVDKHRLDSGITCHKHLLCMLCALRRASALVKTYEELFSHILKENPHLVPVLITYTVKNGSDLSERYEHLTKARQTLAQRRRCCLNQRTTARGRGKDTVLKHVYAAAGSYEFKRGRGSKEWHPHVHEVALIDGRQFEFSEEVRTRKIYRNGKCHEVTRTVQVPKEMRSQLSQEWWMVTGDSYIVDVVRLFPPSADASQQNAAAVRDRAESVCGKFLRRDQQDQEEEDNTLFTGLAEAFKYALKFAELEHADLIEAYNVLKGRRLIYSYGAVRKVELPEESKDNCDDLAGLPYIYKLYRFFKGKGYLLHSVEPGGIQPPSQKKKKLGRPPKGCPLSGKITRAQVAEFIQKEYGRKYVRYATGKKPPSGCCSADDPPF